MGKIGSESALQDGLLEIHEYIVLRIKSRESSAGSGACHVFGRERVRRYDIRFTARNLSGVLVRKTCDDVSSRSLVLSVGTGHEMGGEGCHLSLDAMHEEFVRLKLFCRLSVAFSLWCIISSCISISCNIPQ